MNHQLNTMRIALLFPNNLFTSPYLKYYTQILEKDQIAFDLIIWDRHNKFEEGCIAFKSQDYKKSRISKALDFWKFRNFIKRELKKREYSRVIVFTGQLGIFLSTYLRKNYRGNYILDIRDYSQPMHNFKSLFRKVIRSAKYVVISSNAFKDWLPPSDNYVMGHNIDIDLIDKSLEKKAAPRGLFKIEPIHIDTIGQIKDFASDKKFVFQLKNDFRFQMQFIGFGPTLSELKAYAEQEGIENIDFHGPYKKQEEENLLRNTDVINILISLKEYNKGTTLLSNRLYLSALYNIPCLVKSETEQSRIIHKYDFGIVVDDYKDVNQALIDYRDSFDETLFIDNCRNFLNDVKKDYTIFENKVKALIKEE